MPSSMASNSMVALSVSISARISPDTTLSPSLTSQRASLPSSIVGESAGIVIWIDMGAFREANDGKHSRVFLDKLAGKSKMLASCRFVTDIPVLR